MMAMSIYQDAVIKEQRDLIREMVRNPSNRMRKTFTIIALSLAFCLGANAEFTPPVIFTSCKKADNVCFAKLDTLVELLKRSPDTEVQLITNFAKSPVARKIESYLEDRGIGTERIIYIVDHEGDTSVTVLLQQ